MMVEGDDLLPCFKTVCGKMAARGVTQDVLERVLKQGIKAAAPKDDPNLGFNVTNND
jgi:hypothetical protein